MPDGSPLSRSSGVLFDTGSAATISDCGRYRYTLERFWDAGPAPLFVMLNPSTADASVDDPTIRRCMGFARKWGYAGLLVANLYALRATNPDDLKTAQGPVGEFGQYGGFTMNRNDFELGVLAGRADRVIAAWGAWAGPIPWRPARVTDVLRDAGHAEVCALGLTKDGSPRHPLYLRSDSEPTPWRPTT